MYIINELIISIHIKPEWNSSQALHNMGWATQAWCKSVQRWPYGGQGSREGAVGNWQSNMEYQQREATPPRCTQSEDEQDKNLTYVCFIFECHRHPSLIHKLHLTCISHHLCYHSENKYKDGETCKSIHEKINLN